MNGLIYRVFQSFAWAELWNLGSLDLYRGSSTRIPASTSGAFTYVERAKTYQSDHFAFLQGLFHCIHCSLQSPTCSGFGNVSGYSNRIDQFRLVHKIPLSMDESNAVSLRGVL